MRLIDADKLIDDLCAFFPKEALDGIKWDQRSLFKQIITDIVNSPTIKQLDKSTLCSTCDLKSESYKKGFSDGFEEGRKDGISCMQNDDISSDSLFKEDNNEDDS